MPEAELTGLCNLHRLSWVLRQWRREVHAAAGCKTAEVAREGLALSGVSFPRDPRSRVANRVAKWEPVLVNQAFQPPTRASFSSPLSDSRESSAVLHVLQTRSRWSEAASGCRPGVVLVYIALSSSKWPLPRSIARGDLCQKLPPAQPDPRAPAFGLVNKLNSAVSSARCVRCWLWPACISCTTRLTSAISTAISVPSCRFEIVRSPDHRLRCRRP